VGAGLGGMLLAVLAAGLAVAANVADPPAETVLGQEDFTSGACNGGGMDAESLCTPHEIAVAGDGTLFVADPKNNRVLGYAPPLSNGEEAGLALGQTDFTHGACNRGGRPSASTLCQPQGVAFDADGNLYVGDFGNNRVLRYAPPFANGAAARLVLGQADFVHHACNRVSHPAANTLCGPKTVMIDANGSLYVADATNNRVLRYAPPFANGAAARLVLGQAGFGASACNRGGRAAANTLCGPKALAMDGAGNLFVSDYTNNRLLRFTAPFSNGEAATLVLGQADFAHYTCNRGGRAAANTLCGPGGIAFDRAGDLYLADFANHRALEYLPPFSDGMNAAGVLGQPDFTSAACNQGSQPSASTLCKPNSLTIVGATLYLADSGNNRALAYVLP